MDFAASMISANLATGRFLIAGGGIAGLAAAIALKRRGMESLVCERAPELREVGAGLLLSPNAVHMLDRLGIGQAARASSRIIKDWHILDQRGRRLHRMNPTTRTGIPTLSLHRADLQMLLQSQLHSSALRLNCTVTGYTESSEGVELSDQAGTQITGTALIGADGLNSRIRKLICADIPPRFCGYTGWRSVVPWVPQGYEGHWLSESWGEGKRFGISPLGGNRCYWYASANRSTITPRETTVSREELLTLFGHWHHPIPELIAATPPQLIVQNDIFERANQTPRTNGRVTLLGDAAHAMTPNLGQGACTAMEDAWVLARELATSSSPSEGFRRYERARRFRISCIAYASHALGQLIQLENPVATASRDLFLRITPAFCGNLAMRPLFGFRG